jgi:hypothetical protein
MQPPFSMNLLGRAPPFILYRVARLTGHTFDGVDLDTWPSKPKLTRHASHAAHSFCKGLHFVYVGQQRSSFSHKSELAHNQHTGTQQTCTCDQRTVWGKVFVQVTLSPSAEKVSRSLILDTFSAEGDDHLGTPSPLPSHVRGKGHVRRVNHAPAHPGRKRTTRSILF